MKIFHRSISSVSRWPDRESLRMHRPTSPNAPSSREHPPEIQLYESAVDTPRPGVEISACAIDQSPATPQPASVDRECRNQIPAISRGYRSDLRILDSSCSSSSARGSLRSHRGELWRIQDPLPELPAADALYPDVTKQILQHIRAGRPDRVGDNLKG